MTTDRSQRTTRGLIFRHYGANLSPVFWIRTGEGWLGIGAALVLVGLAAAGLFNGAQ